MIELIIDRPSLQTSRQRLIFGSMTFIFWALWIYLWLPLVALIGWMLGFRIAYYEMIVKFGYVSLQHLLVFYLSIILFLGASLLVWAYYNYFRFRNKARRMQVAEVSVAALSERYHTAPETLALWAQARRLTLHHDAEGRVIGADL